VKFRACYTSQVIRPPIVVLIIWFSILSGGHANPQSTAQDDTILERGEKLLEEAKASYEEARKNASVQAFVDAGFKLEEAKIKFIVVQEIGTPDKQKLATDRLRAVNQLSKLIHDGKVAVNAPPPETPAAAPAEPRPATPAAKPESEAPPARTIDVMKRAPVPDPVRQKESEKIVKDLFKDQYAKKAPADRIALAKALLTQAAKTGEDLPAVWVLYREAQDLAVQNGDAITALKAIESTAREFDVDVMSLKSAALAGLAKTAKTPADFGALSESTLSLVDDLVAADQYDAADKAAGSALQTSRRANDSGLAARATVRVKEVGEARARYSAIRGALLTLAKSPDDPVANNEMGQYLCYVKGNWDLGCRFLVKGSDAALKALAEKELANSLQSTDQVAIADGWWDLAEKEKSTLSKSQMLSHAKALYEAALPGVNGILRAKVEKRLESLDVATGGPLNLLRMVDPKIDGVAGQWQLEGGALTCAALSFARIQIPYQPSEEYDLTIVLTRRSGSDAIVIGLAGGGSQFSFNLDAFSGQGGVAFLDKIEGEVPLEKNPTVVRGIQVPAGRPATLICSVRKKVVSLTLNGKKLMSWEGDCKRLSLPPQWSIPDKKALMIGGFDTAIQISKILLTPVTGQGKKSR